MKQEDKELLLKDLCSRLPYGVIIQIKDWTVLDAELKIGHINRLQINDVELKPYLFPMSSMTEEQKVIYGDLCYSIIQSLAKNMQSELNELINWLNAHHFDYRGLIEKGLAIPVTKENNPYK